MKELKRQLALQEQESRRQRSAKEEAEVAKQRAEAGKDQAEAKRAQAEAEKAEAVARAEALEEALRAAQHGAAPHPGPSQQGSRYPGYWSAAGQALPCDGSYRLVKMDDSFTQHFQEYLDQTSIFVHRDPVDHGTSPSWAQYQSGPPTSEFTWIVHGQYAPS